MKANELMIGDWVCFDGDYQYECPVKIDGLSIDDVSVGEEGFLGDEDQVVPIPLTEDILKANGFEYNENGVLANESLMMHIIIDDHHLDIVKRYDTNGEFDHNESLWLNDRTISYVHELQHALRLCGLNDLADNFKIE